VDYAWLISEIRSRADLTSDDEAIVVLEEVLDALAEAVPQEERAMLADELPGPARERMTEGRIEYDPLIDEHIFLGHLMTAHQTTGYWDRTAGGDDVLASAAAEEIERRARVVLGLIGSAVPPEVLRHLCDAVPPALEGWLREAPLTSD
jgi:uncharacterized protein (DUF2267 family)